MPDYAPVAAAAKRLTVANNVGAERAAEVAYREAFLRYRAAYNADPSTPRLTNR